MSYLSQNLGLSQSLLYVFQKLWLHCILEIVVTRILQKFVILKDLMSKISKEYSEHWPFFVQLKHLNEILWILRKNKPYYLILYGLTRIIWYKIRLPKSIDFTDVLFLCVYLIRFKKKTYLRLNCSNLSLNSSLSYSKIR